MNATLFIESSDFDTDDRVNDHEISRSRPTPVKEAGSSDKNKSAYQL